MIAPETLISEYLPVIKGRVATKYSWVGHKGNCLLTVDDLIQVASITLVKISRVWEQRREETYESDDAERANFWKYLEGAVKNEIIAYFDRTAHARNSPNDPLEWDDGEEHTALRVPEPPMHWDTLNGDIVDFFALMPQRHKIPIALRYFDELPWRDIGVILNEKWRTVHAATAQRVTVWRDFARNQFVDHPKEVSPLKARSWEPPATLIEYVAARHQMDLSEYLGYVTICIRADVSYLTEILGTARTDVLDGHALTISPYQQQIAIEMLDSGATQVEVARRLGITKRMAGTVAKRRSVLYRHSDM